MTYEQVYKERNYNLKAMGYSSYRDYLLSDQWSEIRQRVLDGSNHTCYCCGSKATQVHHTVYLKSVLAGRSLKGLYAVCGKCHYKAEFSYGKKMSPKQATCRLEWFQTVDELSLFDKQIAKCVIDGSQRTMVKKWLRRNGFPKLGKNEWPITIHCDYVVSNPKLKILFEVK